MNGDEQNSEDLELAYALLAGSGKRNEKGLPEHTYLKQGSADELEARRALARLLLDGKPLDGFIRELLAGLFDRAAVEARGSPQTRKHGRSVDRQIRFIIPGRRVSQQTRRLHLAFEVRDKRKRYGKIEAAINAVAKEYEIPEVSVKKAWQEFRRLLPKITNTAH